MVSGAELFNLLRIYGIIPNFLVWFILFSGSINAEASEQREVTEICNHDGTEAVLYAVRDEDGLGGETDGWYEVGPNKCKTVWRWTADGTRHNYVLWGMGEQLDIFWDRAFKGEEVCVRPGKSFSYLANLFSLSRPTRCERGEILVRANYKTTYHGNSAAAYGIDVLHIPAWSGGGSPRDGIGCSWAGVCTPWPGMETSKLKERNLAKKRAANAAPVSAPALTAPAPMLLLPIWETDETIQGVYGPPGTEKVTVYSASLDGRADCMLVPIAGHYSDGHREPRLVGPAALAKVLPFTEKAPDPSNSAWYEVGAMEILPRDMVFFNVTDLPCGKDGYKVRSVNLLTSAGSITLPSK